MKLCPLLTPKPPPSEVDLRPETEGVGRIVTVAGRGADRGVVEYQAAIVRGEAHVGDRRVLPRAGAATRQGRPHCPGLSLALPGAFFWEAA